ncbi:MAG: MFS transporter [Pirellulales bacterium]
MSTAANEPGQSLPPITAAGRYLILATAFLGWFCAGMQMSITSLAMRSAATDLLDRTAAIDAGRLTEVTVLKKKIKSGVLPSKTLGDADRDAAEGWGALIGQWYSWYQCAFLFGAAAGGWMFGRLGDRIGRSKAMAASILCYSVVSAAAYFAQTPLQLLALRFVACMGVGGMWPNGVALVSEAWSNLSRPMIAGVIGTAANIGIFTMSTIATKFDINPESWRWVMLVGAAPVVLGLLSLVAVPESPRWLASRNRERAAGQRTSDTTEVFRRPLLGVTLVGILLATIPLFGGWGSANWMVPWAEKASEEFDSADESFKALKAQVGQARSFTGLVGSFLGGWIASLFGRRRSYCFVSLGALFCAQFAFWFTVPTDPWFLFWVGALGFFSGIYFGWLPLFLPELFPTRLRSTGAGVSFNFGRIITAINIFAAGSLMIYFGENYAQLGRVTSLIFLLGMIVIWFAPDTTEKQLVD